jgi:pimeloyl-ACP methyl ester carboxylesterase
MGLVDADRLILFPGMGCDGRLFAPQRQSGLVFESPRLPIPHRADDLPSYADRVASELGLGCASCILGGISFGGMLACELAARCNCRRILLIASCRSRSAIPARNWPVYLCTMTIPDGMVRRLVTPASWLLARKESTGRNCFRLIRDMARDTPIPVLRRQAAMILGWKAPSSPACPVFHIHGARDYLIPVRGVTPDEVVPDGGHFINMTHPERVNRFVASHLM